MDESEESIIERWRAEVREARWFLFQRVFHKRPEYVRKTGMTEQEMREFLDETFIDWRGSFNDAEVD